MPEPFKFEKPEVNLFTSEDETRAAPSSDTPFRVAVLGDFGGRAGRVDDSKRKLTPVEIDRDNFDEVMRRLGVELRLRLREGDAAPLALTFESLDDFHPDAIYERADLFRALRDTRRRLSDPKTFEEAAAELRRHLASSNTRSASSNTRAAGSSPSAAPPNASDLIEQMLAGSKGGGKAETGPVGDAELGRLVSEIVRPHVVSFDEARQSELIDSVDAGLGQAMRSILRHPDFQSLEARWRALHFLVTRAETDAGLKFYVVDLTREELAEAARGGEGGRTGDLERLLVEGSVGTLGGEPWSLVVGDYTFAPSWVDAELLLRIGDVARRAGAAFVAGADARAVGCDSIAATPDPDDWRREIGEGEDAEAWAALRAHAVARHIGLALPRFLLRLPYGAKTSPVERFDFEEFDAEGEPRHADFLWGNAAFACAHLLAEAFARDGWQMRPGDPNEIGGLPFYTYEADGDARAEPCAETLLSDRAAEAISERGVMPLVSYKDGDRVALARFQSLADPPTRLAGGWS